MREAFIIIEWIITIGEVAAFFMLLHTLTEGRFKERRQMLYCCLISGMVSMGVVLQNLFGLQLSFSRLMYAVVAFGLGAVILYKGRILDIFIMAIVYLEWKTWMDAVLVSVLASVGMTRHLFNFGIQRIAIILGVNICEILLMWLFCKFIKRLKIQFQFMVKNSMLFMICFGGGAVGTYFWMYQVEKMVPIHMNLIQTVIGIVCIWLMVSGYLLYRVREIQKEKAYTVQQNQVLETNYITVKESYESNAKLYHDMRNHMALLQRYLEDEKVPEAKEYLKKLSGERALYPASNYTGLETIDYILSQKKNKAVKNHIQMEIHAEYPKDCKINHVDLCTILTNLLDNAIEACMEQPEGEKRDIQVTIRRVHQFIIIRIANSSITPPKIRDGKLITTKRDAVMHGWGMKSVATAVEKYQGTLDYEYENQVVTVSAMLFY